MPSGFYIDANLLVLLVVGLVDRRIIARHRRTEDYTPQDHDLLQRILAPLPQTFLTPNTLTEAPNLLAQHREPERSKLLATLRQLIDHSVENVVASRDAAANALFPRLGLTDAALLTVVSTDRPLLTVDLDLYLAAERASPGSAVNFNHHRFPDL